MNKTISKHEWTFMAFIWLLNTYAVRANFKIIMRDIDSFKTDTVIYVLWKVDEKEATIRNRHNRIPHPALDTKWERNTYNLDGIK